MAARMIHGIDDELTPLAKEQLSRIKGMMCPRCRAAMAPQLFAPQVFSPNEPLPRTVATCQECGASIDPKSGIVLNVGDPRKVEDDPMILKRQDEED